MKTDYHSILRRQLRRLSLSADATPEDLETWRKFLTRVNGCYQQSDEDRYLIERSLELSSQEMREMYQELERRSNSELARRSAHQDAVMRALEDGLCTLSIHGRCLSANAAALEKLEIAQGDIQEKDILARFLLSPSPDEGDGEDALSDEAQARRKREILERLSSGQTLRFDNAILLDREGNPSLPVSCSLTPLLLDGQVSQIVLLFRDVSSLRQLHEDLRSARDEAIAANRSKSMFLANMSHELRTPLNTIIGYVGLVEEEAEELGAPSLSQDLSKINVAAKHLLQLINNILDLSKIEAGELSIHKASFELSTFLDELYATLEPIIAAHHNQLLFEVRIEQTHLYTDALKLRQMLINLISNAAKFTREGTITLRIRAREQSSDDHQPFLIFDIIDTGSGIPPEKLEGLFQEFKQLDNDATHAAGGTGLGLAISLSLAQMLGGTITAKSKVGEGTTFSIELPLESDPNNN